MTRRSAFTLIELLVVVSIIVVLASITLPIITMVKKMVRTSQCGNNLQQIAAAIEAYKSENLDAFPSRLWRDAPLPGSTIITDDLFHVGITTAQMPTKILLCPFDYTMGVSTSMNRAPAPLWTDLSALYETKCSYEYEMSDVLLTSTTASWFFSNSDPGGVPPTPNPQVTWSSGKHNQQLNGNRASSSDPGCPFPASQFPILRCYWHAKWLGASSIDANLKLINNVSLDMNVFKSSPYWEHDCNPNIPLP